MFFSFMKQIGGQFVAIIKETPVGLVSNVGIKVSFFIEMQHRQNIE